MIQSLVDFNNGWLGQKTKEFACSMANMVFKEDDLKNSGECGNSWSGGNCGEMPLLGVLPTYQCYQEMLDGYGEKIKTKLQSANTAFKKSIEKSGLVNSAKVEGWPSMAWWYYDLYNLNFVVMGAGKSPILINSGGSTYDTKVKEYYTKWWKKVLDNNYATTGMSQQGGTTSSTSDTTSGGTVALPQGAVGDP